ncbi:MAG TPA: aromatic ring-hydroxylating dioxygenase subunit alpha [bacterium]
MSNKLYLSEFDEKYLHSPPIERAETIPSSWYTASNFHLFDNEAILSRTWQYVGWLQKVQKAGDYFIAEVANNPIIVVRGQDEKLRAFYNVCRHRGGPLAIADGCAKALQCKYHGWTYLLDGSLRGVPEFDRVELFDKKDYGLIPVNLEVWEGLLFVNLSEQPTPLIEYFKGIAERISPIKLTGKKVCKRIVYELACNWKVYVDNYLEGYHLPYVHPELCNLLDYLKYVTEIYRYYSLQYSPFTKNDNLYQASAGEAFYYFIFPNFMLNILPGRLQTNLIVPLAHDRTRVLFDFFYDDIDSPAAKKIIADDIEYSDRVQKEDMEICEYVQRGLQSRAYDRGRFSVKCEQGVYHFQTLLKEFYRNA